MYMQASLHLIMAAPSTSEQNQIFVGQGETHSYFIKWYLGISSDLLEYFCPSGFESEAVISPHPPTPHRKI